MSEVMSADGTRIAYDRSGDGPPVVYVGPAMADRAAAAPVAARLSAAYTAYNYDRRGRGGSGDTPPYAVEREIEDLSAIIDGAGEPACVVGRGSGAVLALDAAAHGLPISRMVLYEPPFVVDASGTPVPAGFREGLETLIAEGRRADAVDQYMTVMRGVPAGRTAGMRNTPFWEEWEALAATLPYDAAILEGTQTGGPLPAERWSRLSVPTLVLTGGESSRSIHAGAKALAELLPGVVEHRILPGQAHTVDSDILAAAVIEYLSAAPAASDR